MQKWIGNVRYDRFSAAIDNLLAAAITWLLYIIQFLIEKMYQLLS